MLVLAAMLFAPLAPAAAQGAAEEGTPVVLELFTSLGCSSCPPAEELLSRLGLDAEMRSAVIPLAYHVDYWDRLGWRDPFSSAAWTERQDGYARVLGVQNGPYTPQLVVNGEAELNGTDGRRILGSIAAARRRTSPAAIAVTARLDGAARPVLAVEASVEMLQDVEARKLDLRIAVFENGMITEVKGGENGGRTLANDFVVRRLDTALSVEPVKGARNEGRLRLKLARGWKPGSLGVAALLQDPRSMRIVAAAAATASGPEGAAQPSARSRVTTSTSPRQP
jgi:hypothetical protein